MSTKLKWVRPINTVGGFVIPKAIRDSLDLKPGGSVVVEHVDGRFVIRAPDTNEKPEENSDG